MIQFIVHVPVVLFMLWAFGLTLEYKPPVVPCADTRDSTDRRVACPMRRTPLAVGCALHAARACSRRFRRARPRGLRAGAEFNIRRFGGNVTLPTLLECRSLELNSWHSSWRMLQLRRDPVHSHLFSDPDVSSGCDSGCAAAVAVVDEGSGSHLSCGRAVNKSGLRHEYSG
jgi:hypothetical protein